jgi:hypothetical protein
MRTSILLIVAIVLAWSSVDAAERPTGSANPALGISREAQLILDEMPSKGATWGTWAKKLEEEVQKSPHGKDTKIFVNAALADRPITGHVQQFPPGRIGGPIGNYPLFMFLARFTDGMPVNVSYAHNLVSIGPKALKKPGHP